MANTGAADEPLPQSAFRRYLKTGVTGHNRAKAEQAFLADALFFKREKFLSKLTGEVAQPAAHFQDDCGFRLKPAESANLPHELPAIGESVQGLARFPEQVRDRGYNINKLN